MSRLRGSDVEWLAFCGVSVTLIDWLDHLNRLPVRWWFVVLVLAFVMARRRVAQ